MPFLKWKDNVIYSFYYLFLEPSPANSSSQANLIETEDYKKLHIQKNIQSLIQKVLIEEGFCLSD